MRIRVVSSREEIFTLNPNERLVHLTSAGDPFLDISGLPEMAGGGGMRHLYHLN